MGGSLKITVNLEDPTDSADAANKKYVNDEDAALLAQVLQLSGGTMSDGIEYEQSKYFKPSHTIRRY